MVGVGFSSARARAKTPRSCICPRGRTPLRLEKLIDLAIAVSANPCDRSLSRAFALREKIGGKGGTGDYIEKPKGMHARTFERAMEKVYAAEEIVDAHCDLLLDRLMRRSP